MYTIIISGKRSCEFEDQVVMAGFEGGKRKEKCGKYIIISKGNLKIEFIHITMAIYMFSR